MGRATEEQRNRGSKATFRTADGQSDDEDSSMLPDNGHSKTTGFKTPHFAFLYLLLILSFKNIYFNMNKKEKNTHTKQRKDKLIAKKVKIY